MSAESDDDLDGILSESELPVGGTDDDDEDDGAPSLTTEQLAERRQEWLHRKENLERRTAELLEKVSVDADAEMAKLREEYADVKFQETESMVRRPAWF